MLRDITLGQYYPKDSVIHRLDPRVKILAVIVYSIMLFLTATLFLCWLSRPRRLRPACRCALFSAV